MAAAVQASVYAGGATIAPKIPYCEKLPKFNPGDIIIIAGDVPFTSRKCALASCMSNPGAKECGENFRIDLAEMGPDGKIANILLHVGVRFYPGVVVRNSQRGDSWQTEERAGGLGGLELGKPFECLIMLHRDVFKIAFNGQHLADFEHRSPHSSISHLAIQGSVQVRSIQVQPGPGSLDGSRLLAMPDIGDWVSREQGTQTDDVENTKEVTLPYHIFNPSLPHIITVPGGVTPPRLIYINGMPLDEGESFTVNLRSGVSRKDIALHVNPRFPLESVVMNTQTGGKWGSEQRVSGRFPFTRGAHYDLTILCTADCYMLAVNNQHFTEYKHRHSQLDTVTDLEIFGATRIIHIRVT